MNKQNTKRKKFVVGGEAIGLKQRKILNIDIGHLYDFTSLHIPIEVIRGYKEGPVLFLSGAIHGDEINGSEIIRRVISKLNLNTMVGTVIAAPVINVFGFNTKSRYLPDRRDLNRSFPGSKTGSLAAQMAKIFMNEIVSKATHGIDFHTGAVHRFNVPQIRACIEDPKTKSLAKAFNAKVIINSKLRDGSLREAARKKGVTTLLFEGGEALRFDEDVIKSGVKGTLSVLNYLGMIPSPKYKQSCDSAIAKDSFWVRSPCGGSMKTMKKAGENVVKGDCLAEIQDLLGKEKIEVKAPSSGIIIGRTRLPLVNKGDALFHIATKRKLSKSQMRLVSYDKDTEKL